LVYISVDVLERLRFPLKKSEKYQHQFSVLRSIRPPPQVSEVRVYTLRNHHGNDGACRSLQLLQHYREHESMCSSSMCLRLPPSPFFTYNSADRGVVNGSNFRGTERSALDEKVAATARPEEEEARSVETLSFNHLKICQPMNTNDLANVLVHVERALSESYAQYMSTWEGFFSSQGFIVQSKDDDVQIKKKLRWLPK
jgi:hypothetical protein